MQMLVRLEPEQAMLLLREVKATHPPSSARQALVRRLQEGCSRPAGSDWWLLECSESDAGRTVHYARPDAPQGGYHGHFCGVADVLQRELERFELIHLSGGRGWHSLDVRGWWLQMRQGAGEDAG